MEKRDYLIDQIEKITQLIATLVARKQVKPEVIDQSITELTGLDASFFDEPLAAGLILRALDDDNKKALIAKLLLMKDPSGFKQIFGDTIADLDTTKLNPKIRLLLGKD